MMPMQNNMRCLLITIALINMKYCALLLKCANTGRDGCKSVDLARVLYFYKAY